MHNSRLRIYPWCHQKNEKRIEKGITFSLCDSILFAKLVLHLTLSVAFHTWGNTALSHQSSVLNLSEVLGKTKECFAMEQLERRNGTFWKPITPSVSQGACQAKRYCRVDFPVVTIVKVAVASSSCPVFLPPVFLPHQG